MTEQRGDHQDLHLPDYTEYSDPEAVERLRAAGIEGLEFAFGIESETDSMGEPIPADIFWIRFEKPEGADVADCAAVEGKLYLPREVAKQELILFTPGFPGGNAGRFEQLYANAFVIDGYSFFTIRHNGASVSKMDTAPEIINCPRRLELAREHQEQHISGTLPDGHSPVEIIKETITPLLALQKSSKAIHLMGQSMGVAASYQALTRMAEHYPDVADKIQHVVGIAGYVGGAEGTEGEQWDGMKMPMQQLSEYEMGYIAKAGTNTVTSPDAFRREMQKVAEANEGMVVPDHVSSVLVFTPEDPLIAGPNKEKTKPALNYGPAVKRKLIIRDESTLEDPKHNGKQHSMLWIKPENLLRAVKVKVSGHGPHYIKVPNKGEGMLEKG